MHAAAEAVHVRQRQRGEAAEDVRTRHGREQDEDGRAARRGSALCVWGGGTRTTCAEPCIRALARMCRGRSVMASPALCWLRLRERGVWASLHALFVTRSALLSPRVR
jgi:hypothetical protein